MFFLKKMLNQYIEKKQFHREYAEFAKNLETVTNTKYEMLKAMYSCDILPHDIGNVMWHVEHDFLSKFDLYACSYRFPSSVESTKKFKSVINDFFQFSENRSYNRINDSGQTESLHLVVRDIFAVNEIEVITNSSTFIQLLNETPIACPPPWLAFPGLTLAEFHPSQGETGFYNEFFWDPFWLGLDKKEKEQYYATESIPKEWEEHMRFLDELRESD